MKILGRSRELGRLRSFLDARQPHLVTLTGVRGAGKSALVRHALADYPGMLHLCPPLPDPDQRALLAARLRSTPDEEGREAPPANASWEEIFNHVLDGIDTRGRPFVLVLDDAHRLNEARSRYAGPLFDTLRRASQESLPFHVVLLAPGGGVSPADVLDGWSEETPWVEGVHGDVIQVGPLPFRAAAPRLPGRSPPEKLRAYGVLGGIPRVLEKVDNSVTVGTNVRRLLLAPEGALADLGAVLLERDLQAPARYYAILRALARGEADWATVHAGVPDLTRSGQVAPYLKKLEELGLVEARRSLDAAPAGRSRRYALTDPFLAFWFRFVLPWRWTLHPPAPDAPDEDGDHYARAVRPRVDEHLQTVFPLVCRQHMQHDAIETLGHAAREGGSLWGPGYDLPVAGILTSGAAYYGLCRWTTGEDDAAPFPLMDQQIRETRYGFGRERRLRLLFTGRPVSARLRREAARRRDAELIDAEALLG